ncbi:MAG: hypothetical protein AAF549_00340 [Pseudomonadota bacterium]
MGYQTNRQTLHIRNARRIFRTRHKLFKLTLSIALLFSFIISIPAQAIETVKASAIMPEDIVTSRPLSFTHKIPPRADQTDPCLPLLGSVKAVSSYYALPGRATNRQQVGQKAAAPVALGLIFGVRVALGPKEVIRGSKRVEIGPEIHAVNNGGTNSRALAIAAYRSCKNDYALKQQ